jgi:ferrochelatase
VTDDSARYDAVLYVSFGGPEGPDEVMPFLRRVTAGRNIPDERLEEVAEHYHAHDGRSPINDQNRAVITALRPALAAAGIDLPVYFGNRNSAPLLADTLRQIERDGHQRVLAYVTAAFSSYSGCRQYRENLASALADSGADLQIDKIRVFFNHPGFVEAQADRVRDALASLDGTDVRLLFVTHSIPRTMARHSEYVAQHLEACRLVAEQAVPTAPWELVFCSRSGPPHVPWLTPDVNDRLRDLADSGDGRAVVLVPIGFVSDHMEVIHDLDVEAAATAADAGLRFVRAATVGTHGDFVAGIVDLIRERMDPGHPRAFLGPLGPWHDACPADCCLVPGTAPKATVAGATG